MGGRDRCSGSTFAEAVLFDGGVGPLWPGTPPRLVWALTGALVFVLAAPVLLVFVRGGRRAPAPGDPLQSLATEVDVVGLTPAGVAARAVQLRPSLRSLRKPFDARDTGVALGRLQTVRGVVTNVEEAHRLAGHFVQEVRSDRGERDFWTAAAHDLLTGLLLAAALSRQSLVEVYE